MSAPVTENKNLKKGTILKCKQENWGNNIPNVKRKVGLLQVLQ